MSDDPLHRDGAPRASELVSPHNVIVSLRIPKPLGVIHSYSEMFSCPQLS
jgi:hypothetical protein